MICRYCNKELSPLDDEKGRFWYRCADCLVHYASFTRHANNDCILLHSIDYIIDIRLGRNTFNVFKTRVDTTQMTILEVWEREVSGDCVFRGEGIDLINSFTPVNIKSKVETLLLLS